ncbi:Uma2 family endonuclease [Actinocrispum wychmicini]|uniref:Putative restriction endonuclease n=1 Tax=Actinocrispum wychmicini TaxID=1213861 RepID=A0A4R2IIS6_9PSEU|nr:Uma2 family endonuclease [Actinocrispum wychmicini]TCO44202.1 putative restriction endonuclease [Actinocrispum wychmicini]
MSAALEHPLGPFTVKDWLAMDPPADGSRLELLWGYLHVTPAPSTTHQYAAGRLIRPLEDAFAACGRTDLYVVPAPNVRISTGRRLMVIPDLVVSTREPAGVSFGPEELALIVEIWSPGNPREEREDKMAGYTVAGVPFVWTIDRGHDLAGMTLTAHRFVDGSYVAENRIQTDGSATITAAPVPIDLDLSALLKRSR